MAIDKLPSPGFFEKHRDKIAIIGPDECWLWTAGTNGGGYGALRSRGRMRKAHREAYEDKNGEGSADGLVVRHRCDTPLCVNPNHLEAGTHADNVRDKVERGRQATGKDHGRAKLTEADVRTIRAECVRGSGTHGYRALARRFGVAHTVIGYVVRRETWGHVS